MSGDRGPGPTPARAEAALAASLFDGSDRPRLEQLAAVLARLHSAEQRQAIAPLLAATGGRTAEEHQKLLDGWQSLLKGSGYVAREVPSTPALQVAHEAEPLASWLTRRRLPISPVRLYARGETRVLIRRPRGTRELLIERFSGTDDLVLLAASDGGAQGPERNTPALLLAISIAVLLAVLMLPAPHEVAPLLLGGLGMAELIRRDRRAHAATVARAEACEARSATGRALLLDLAQQVADRRTSETLLAFGGLWLNGPKRRSELEAIVARILDPQGAVVVPLAGALATLARLGLIEPEGPGFVPQPYEQAMATLRERWLDIANAQ